MSKPSSNPRKKRTLGPPIDLDELYNAPNLRGMLSFLERPPEEARRRYEQKVAVDRAVAEQTGGTLPSPAENDLKSPNAIKPLEPDHERLDIPSDSAWGVSPKSAPLRTTEAAETPRSTVSAKFSDHDDVLPTVGEKPTVGISRSQTLCGNTEPATPTAGSVPTAGVKQTGGPENGGSQGINVGREPTKGTIPTVGMDDKIAGSELAVGMPSDSLRPSGAIRSQTLGENTEPATLTAGSVPTGGMKETGGLETARSSEYGEKPTDGPRPTVGSQVEVVAGELAVDTPSYSLRPYRAIKSQTLGGNLEPATLTAGLVPTAGLQEARGLVNAGTGEYGQAREHTEASRPTVGMDGVIAASELVRSGISSASRPMGEFKPTVGIDENVATVPIESFRQHSPQGPNTTLGPQLAGVNGRKVKLIRDVQDALTLAGQLLYKAMYGVPDGARSKTCSKGYRQLAAEAHVDKDTVRDLIADFKEKGIVRETGSYNADTRASKTYEILSYKAILQLWREVGINHVISGRRPLFCDSSGTPISFRPTVGLRPSPSLKPVPPSEPKSGEAEQPQPPTIVSSNGGPSIVTLANMSSSEAPNQGGVATALRCQVVIQALNEAFGHVDDDVVRRIVAESRKRASDATDEEIALFVRATTQRLRRMRNLDNPVGMMITQVPKCFEGESFKQHRQAEHQRRIAAEVEDRRFRQMQQAILNDPDSSEADKNWAREALQIK